MSRRKKVLILIKGLGLGGAEKLLASSVPYLDRSTFEYELAYFTPWKQDLVPEFEVAGVPVHCLDSRFDPDPLAALRLGRLLRQRNVDLLHSHSPYPAVFGRLASPFAGVGALVHTEHNMPRAHRRTTRVANRLTYPLSNATIAVSREVSDAVSDVRFLRPPALQVIYGGVDEAALELVDDAATARARSRFGIPEGHRVIGNVAHLRAQKGHAFFVQAARFILDDEPETTFVLIGREKEPGYVKTLEAQAGELGISERIIFTGFQAEPYPIVANFDLFMMSSLYEGLPVAMMEAMALGKPVVAPDVGGIKEAVQDGVNGLLVNAAEPRALADKALILLRDHALRERMSEKARARIHQKFSIRSMVSETESVYRTLLGID